MSVKKLLATILALTMVLTMASFPAFAEGEAAEIPDNSITVDSNLAPEGTWTPVSGIADGVRTTDGGRFFKSARKYDPTAGTVFGSFVFDFGKPYSITEILFQMGGCHMTYGKLYASSTVSDPNATEGWEYICDLGSSEQDLAYTTASEGAGVQTTVTIPHKGYYSYYKIDVIKVKEANNNFLVWIETDFYGSENPERTPVKYTVKYVDENENLLDSEELDGYVGYPVTAEPKEIDGYKAPEGSETITLDADPTKNVITFTYTKITADTPVAIKPIGVNSPFSTRGGYSLWGLIDGKMSQNSERYRIGESAPHVVTGKTGDHTGEFTDDFNFTVDLGNEYKLTKVKPTWGGEFATGVALYGSKDGVTWKEIGNFTEMTSKEQEFLVTDEGYYRYVKVEAYATKGYDTCCQDISFEGVLSPNSIPSSDVRATTNIHTEGKGIGTVVDGVAYKGDYPDYAYFDSQALGSVVFEFNEPKNLAEIWFNMGSSGYITGAKLYASNSVSDPDASGWTDLGVDLSGLSFTEVRSGTPGFANQATATVEHDGYYKYFKLEITSVASENLVWLETIFKGTTGTATPDEPQETPVTALGATIRLEGNGLKAGIRFGAQIDKALAGIDGTYAYSDAADVKFGMFMLPVEMLGTNATLAAYLEAQDDDIGDALDIVARNILFQDDNVIQYTAVLTKIPEGAWNQTIVAVPYMLTDGVYTYFEEKTQSYIGVAEAAIYSYENGNPNKISAEDYNTLLGIVG